MNKEPSIKPAEPADRPFAGASHSRLSFNGIVKQYGERAVVDHLTLSVQSGTIAALAGVNGSGKSTLFRIAAGFVQAEQGSITISDPDSDAISLLDMPPSRRVILGLNYLSQERRLLHGLSTLGNLQVAQAAVNRTSERGAEAILNSLRELRLMSLMDTKPSKMGRADATKLLLAKAYLQSPRFFIMDEPFAGLDRQDTYHCVAIMRKMRDQGTGILVTDHNPAALLEIADIVHIIENGRIVFSDSAEAASLSNNASRLYFRRRA